MDYLEFSFNSSSATNSSTYSMNTSTTSWESQEMEWQHLQSTSALLTADRAKAASYADLVSGRCTVKDVMQEFRLNGSDAPYNPDDEGHRRSTDELPRCAPVYRRQQSWPPASRQRPASQYAMPTANIDNLSANLLPTNFMPSSDNTMTTGANITGLTTKSANDLSSSANIAALYDNYRPTAANLISKSSNNVNNNYRPTAANMTANNLYSTANIAALSANHMPNTTYFKSSSGNTKATASNITGLSANNLSSAANIAALTANYRPLASNFIPKSSNNMNTSATMPTFSNTLQTGANFPKYDNAMRAQRGGIGSGMTLNENAPVFVPMKYKEGYEEKAVSPPPPAGLTEHQRHVLGTLPRGVVNTFLRALECRFCKSNGERDKFSQSHRLKDAWGRVVCPILRVYVCVRCGGTGDNAHTIKYCPYSTKEERILSEAMRRSKRMASGRRRARPTAILGGQHVQQGYVHTQYEPDPVWLGVEHELQMRQYNY